MKHVEQAVAFTRPDSLAAVFFRNNPLVHDLSAIVHPGQPAEVVVEVLIGDTVLEIVGSQDHCWVNGIATTVKTGRRHRTRHRQRPFNPAGVRFQAEQHSWLEITTRPDPQENLIVAVVIVVFG